ncbi:hypothetical protein ASPZODRAFT_133198 [Penicilliopsis zonata CBS 506.65]|uniref:Aminoglycoside phosphotransferase domain-containing protein n=1 Tax=Penicilliopsis zonata CBS 506.65 TaxID=1073090 RepID=A0A1L9SGE3_9EURO|nr:hypothetical protein ASPZODRAFT_133198 [Penicilliopsis zonata CBS 506.65]OJJ46198.1 hypothetical protein ASPZODRAFT_133198 [Penicilliopsis zonata CBS 506.65]
MDSNDQNAWEDPGRQLEVSLFFMLNQIWSERLRHTPLVFSETNYEESEISTGHHLAWAGLFPCTSSGARISFRMFIELHFALTRTGSHLASCLVKATAMRFWEISTATMKTKSMMQREHYKSSRNFNPSFHCFFHPVMSMQKNILVQSGGELAGVLDWECVSALPLWKACDYPAFLQESPRRLEPDPRRYDREANGELADLYWEHRWEYEVTLLREIFVDEMKRLEPGWVDVFNKSHRQRDFDIAVENCDNEFVARHILAWIN